MTATKWGIVLFVVLTVLALIFAPLAIIWAINTLVTAMVPVAAIPYNFWSWLAVVVLNLTWFYKSKITFSS